MESAHTECVKIGLEILTLFGEPSEDLKDVICALALYDEFTLPALWNIARWPEGSRQVFDIAKHTRGWGRIHAVNTLQPKTEEMKHWLLTEGIDNDIAPGYSAISCWDKGEAERILERGDISDAEFSAILRLIAVFDEGPGPGISVLENAEEVLCKVIGRAHTSRITPEICEYIESIRSWAEDEEPPVKSVKDAAEKFLHSPGCRRAVEQAVQEGRCTSLAEELGIPFFDQLYQCMKDNFDTMWMNCVRFLAEPSYTEPVLDLFRAHLPLDKLTGRIDSDLLFTGDFYPYMQLDLLLVCLKDLPLTGIDFVLCALHAAAERTRIGAVKLLQAWVQKTGLPLADLSPDLYQALQSSLTADTPASIRGPAEPLLEGFTVFEEAPFSADAETSG